MTIRTNASAIADRFRYRVAQLRGGITRGLRKWAAEVDAEQVDLIRGGENPGDYPVRVRPAGEGGGGLLKGHFFKLTSATTAVVGNRSDHAVHVHEGLHGNAVHGRRPFLDDAVQAVDGQAIMAVELRKALRAV